MSFLGELVLATVVCLIVFLVLTLLGASGLMIVLVMGIVLFVLAPLMPFLANITILISALLLGWSFVHLGHGIAGVLVGIGVLVLGLWANSIEGPGGESGGGDF